MNTFILSGRANHNSAPMNPWHEEAERERAKLAKAFPGKRLPKSHHLDKISLIRKYQQISLRERYPFGIPPNLITPDILTQGRKLKSL